MDPDKKVSHSNIAVLQPVSQSVPQIAPNRGDEKPIARKPIKHGAFSTPSILEALKDDPKSEKQEHVVHEDGARYSEKEEAKSFSESELIEAWKFFVNTIDAPQLKSALSAREPSLNSDWKIGFELDTELQYNRLTLDLKPKLQGYLRRRFENEAIEILFTVSEGNSIQTGIPYTDEERWNLLVSKYPALASLKSKFGLDFEHY